MVCVWGGTTACVVSSGGRRDRGGGSGGTAAADLRPRRHPEQQVRAAAGAGAAGRPCTATHLGRDERDGDALFLGPCGPPRAVHVDVDGGGQLVVHHAPALHCMGSTWGHRRWGAGNAGGGGGGGACVCRRAGRHRLGGQCAANRAAGLHPSAQFASPPVVAPRLPSSAVPPQLGLTAPP